MLELIVEFRAVESVRTEVPYRETALKGKVEERGIIFGKKKIFLSAVIAVQPSLEVPAVAVRTDCADACKQAETPCRIAVGQIGVECSEGAALHLSRNRIRVRFLCHHIDSTDKGRGAIDSGRGTFEDLDPLDLGEAHREIGRIVAGLRVRNVDSVEQNGYLVGGTTPHADVGLHAHRTSLADIHPGNLLEEIVHCLGWNRGDGHAVHHGHDPCAGAQRHRRTGGVDRDGFQCPDGIGIGVSRDRVIGGDTDRRTGSSTGRIGQKRQQKQCGNQGKSSFHLFLNRFWFSTSKLIARNGITYHFRPNCDERTGVFGERTGEIKKKRYLC